MKSQITILVKLKYNSFAQFQGNSQFLKTICQLWNAQVQNYELISQWTTAPFDLPPVRAIKGNTLQLKTKYAFVFKTIQLIFFYALPSRVKSKGVVVHWENPEIHIFGQQQFGHRFERKTRPFVGVAFVLGGLSKRIFV